MNALLSTRGGVRGVGSGSGGGGGGGVGAGGAGVAGSASGSDGVSVSGRVATGVAVACGVGAAAYLAYRLYNREAVARRAQQETESKVLYLIRHGQSTFNAAYETSGIDPMLFDAPLSALGRRQVMELRSTMLASGVEGTGEGGDGGEDDGDGGDNNRLNPVPEVVLVSPLTRALQTAVGSFAGTGIPVEVLPDLREHLTESCDVGRPARVLAAEFPTVSFHALLAPTTRAEDDDTITTTTSNTDDRAASSCSSTSTSASALHSSSSSSDNGERGGGGGGGLWAGKGTPAGRYRDVWWYVDPAAEPPLDTAEACRRDFMTYGFVEPESAGPSLEAEARRRVAAALDAIRRRPEKTVALVGHADFFNMLAAKIDPRGEELWLENCGVASYTLPPLPPALRSVRVTRSPSPATSSSNKGSAAAA